MAHDNKRYAFEWFMKSEDKRYWKQTQQLVEEKAKRITALAVTSTVIAGLAFTFSALMLRKSR